MADDFNLGDIENRINDPAVLQAARRAAVQYENDLRKGLYNSGDDVDFTSDKASAYTNLLNAICNYAVQKKSDGYSPKDKNTSNVKSHTFKSNKVPFDQLAVIIYDVKQGGCRRWRYAPYGLVYPNVSDMPKNLSPALANVAQSNSNSKEIWNKVNDTKDVEKYIDFSRKTLQWNDSISGGDAAQSLNETLIKRKTITDDFSKDIRGDNILNDFCRVLVNRLQTDSDFREDFFATAQGSQRSELYRWLLAVGYTKDLIYELSGYQN